ncbi:MAG: DUF192 domain-containing protein [Treponema sp.]|nr:DUF192 domain-containing protein [Treponema sp.]
MLFVVSSIGACTAKSAKPGNGGEPLYHGKPQTGLETAVITITGQNKVFLEVELARTETEHAAGLMYRTELEDGKGMLFIFEKDEVRSFWMKNTLIPLSIAYISYDGKIIDIRDMHPHDTNPVRSSRSVRYALEVPHGWFSRAGIKTGDMVENF